MQAGDREVRDWGCARLSVQLDSVLLRLDVPPGELPGLSVSQAS